MRNREAESVESEDDTKTLRHFLNIQLNQKKGTEEHISRYWCFNLRPVASSHIRKVVVSVIVVRQRARENFPKSIPSSLLDPSAKTCYMFRAQGCGLHTLEHCLPVVHVIGRAPGGNSGIISWKALVTKHVCLLYGRSRTPNIKHVPQSATFHCLHIRIPHAKLHYLWIILLMHWLTL